MKRILLALTLAAGLLVLFSAMNAEATPIRPDIRKLVEEPENDRAASFIPARAGWDGPEMADAAMVNPAWQAITNRASANRATLIALATPDPRAVLGIIAVIFLLRILRDREQRARETGAPVAMPPPPQEQERQAA